MGTQEMQVDVQDTISMFEQHHPDIMSTLTDYGMSTNEARQYLSRVVEMSLMNHILCIKADIYKINTKSFGEIHNSFIL